MQISENVDKKGISYLIGIDEVGRGPLAGPVILCAVLIPLKKSEKILKHLVSLGVRDSKKLTEEKREYLFKEISILKNKGEIFVKTSSVSAKKIDEEGIGKSIKRSIKNILNRFSKKPHKCLVKLDGSLKAPEEYKYQETIIKGDDKEVIIAAASVMAKVTRDRKMKGYHKKFPEYDFHIHKGYGTLGHRNKIKKHGLSVLHRRSFCRSLI